MIREIHQDDDAVEKTNLRHSCEYIYRLSLHKGKAFDEETLPLQLK